MSRLPDVQDIYDEFSYGPMSQQGDVILTLYAIRHPRPQPVC
ncbi:hypothetical protein [Candidatus Amarolinea aalborgensis]